MGNPQLKAIWFSSPLVSRVRHMRFVRRKLKGIPFLGRGKENNEKLRCLCPTSQQGGHLCYARKGGARPGLVKEAQRESGGAPAGVVYKMQHSPSVNFGTPRKKSKGIVCCQKWAGLLAKQRKQDSVRTVKTSASYFFKCLNHGKSLCLIHPRHRILKICKNMMGNNNLLYSPHSVHFYHSWE